MPVDPQVRSLLDLIDAVGLPPFAQLTAPEARELFRAAVLRRRGEGWTPPPVGAVADREIAGPGGLLPVRVYAPEVTASSAPPLPVLVYFHGGGWVIGDLDTHDPTCRRICGLGEMVVVSVDYRLAPEHPYPAALDDCLAATCWVSEHAVELGADPTRLAVGGDSAGGNLAAAVTLRARDGAGPDIAAQFLVYPATDPTMGHPSIEENGAGYYLTRPDMEWFGNAYLPDPALRTDPYAGPLHAPDLAGLPPAVVTTAEFDPLRDEGDAYAQRLAAAGVAVTHLREPGLIHGYFGFTDLVAAADRARDEAIRAFAGLLRSGA